jgi:hypothetical protein
MVRQSGIMVAMVLGLVLAGARTTQAQPSASATVTFSELNDYGEWYKLPKRGWVWSPYADPDWRPFLYGHWVWSVDGWAWVSYEPFGWICCHYGYWYLDDEIGWVWVPDYEWSPARVRWVVTDYEIGWAPLSPPGWIAPKAFTPRGYRYWVVVPSTRFTEEEVYRHRVVERRGPPHPVKRRVVRRTAPKVDFVKRKVKQPVHQVKIKKAPETAGKRKLIKVQVHGEGHVGKKRAVPVGPKFRPAHPKKKGVKVIRGSTSPGVKSAPGAEGRRAPAAKKHVAPGTKARPGVKRAAPAASVGKPAGKVQAAPGAGGAKGGAKAKAEPAPRKGDGTSKGKHLGHAKRVEKEEAKEEKEEEKEEEKHEKKSHGAKMGGKK